jgi:hypothetical protein
MSDFIYFNPGDIVLVKGDLANKPLMKVKRTQKMKITNDDKPLLVGIICFWFTSDGHYQEATFNTKDLEHYKG